MKKKHIEMCREFLFQMWYGWKIRTNKDIIKIMEEKYPLTLELIKTL